MRIKVEEFIDKWEMISEDDVVIVGVSGGADSVALLILLDELRKDRGFTIRAVHVNHGIRGGDADRDEAYVKSLCEQRDIPVACVREDVPAYAKKHKISEEEAGREIRRKFFEVERKLHDGTKIALAHHQEDNAETFFLNLARGSRLKGLGGICPVKGEYIRPLLCVGRNEIEKFLEERNIKYCMDATNLEDTYMRNRIRNHVIPFFRENINEKTVEHMNAAMEYLREVQCFLNEEEERAWKKTIYQTGTGYLIRAGVFQVLPGLMKKMIVRSVLVKAGGKEKDLQEIHVCEVMALMDRQTGRKIDLPYGLEARRCYEGILVSVKTKKDEGQRALAVELEDGSVWEYAGMTFRCRVFEKSEEELLVPKKTFTKWFDYDIITKNVSMRARQPGDRIVIDERGHSKKLKTFYVDEKIPSERRDMIPILACENDVLWIVGYRQSKKYQITKETKTIVEVVVDGGD